jgi:hypothetical protein
LLNKFLEN